jgi:hypothetical protein
MQTVAARDPRHYPFDKRITLHWKERVPQRIGRVDPVDLALSLLDAIRREAWHLVEFVGRVSREGLRLFRFRVCDLLPNHDDHRWFHALVDTRKETCITVFPLGFAIPLQGKGLLKLREPRTW